jgi:hypothetical protein
MPAAVESSIKRKVVQEWLSGEARDKIAADNNIGEGTVSNIINYFKIGLDNSEFDSARELSLQAKKQGLTLSELSLHVRLYNYFRSSGASEDQVESFIANVSTSDIAPEKAIELVNQLHEISRGESIPLQELPGYIKQKLDEKRNIDKLILRCKARMSVLKLFMNI